MKRILLFLCCLSIPWIARGQVALDWQYWFDTEQSPHHSGTSQDSTFSIQADVDTLKEGLHAIHVQVADTAGRWSNPQTRMFFIPPNRDIKRVFYWFDNDRSAVSELSASETMIDASSLSEGTHSIHLQTEDMQGYMSDVCSRMFYIASNHQIKRVLYWFDDKGETVLETPSAGSPAIIDVSSLVAGLHNIYFSTEDNLNYMSDVSSRMFYKMPQVDSLKWTYWFDNDEHAADLDAIPGDIVWIDVKSFPVGLHTFHCQAIGRDASSDMVSRMFYKLPGEEDLKDLTCLCFIDGKLVAEETLSATGGIVHWDMDLSNLEVGIHKALIQISSPTGGSSSYVERYFMRIGSGISQYDYWLNEDGPIHSTKLENEVSPYSLISLLPVESMPVRSSCFHFEVKNDQPYIYAKNDIHFRFYDGAGRAMETTKQFVDYAVGSQIEMLTPLTSGQREWKNVPSENNIHWFTAQATRGDSLGIKATQATSLQIFSPSGQEVYSASGSTSIAYGGCHASEDGTYYIALHDVKGSSPTIGLDYEHIDRYAVLRQDISVVGNGGPSTITFEGNGFDELESVELRLGENTLIADSIEHNNKATTSVTFDFEGAVLGQYTAYFNYKEGDIVVEKSITVEEATPLVFNASIYGTGAFLVSTGRTLTLSIKNNSNMTAENVPIMIHFYTNDSTYFNKIKFKNYDVKKGLRSLFGNNYTSQIDSILGTAPSDNDLCFFLKESQTTYHRGAPYRYHTIITPTIKPNSTEQIKIKIETSLPKECYLYAWIIDRNEESNAHQIHRQRAYLGNPQSYADALDAYEPGWGSSSIDTPKSSNRRDKPDSHGKKAKHSGERTQGAHSLDPNEIFGYRAESGSTYIKDGLQDLNYTIEFENDPEFATASAHTVVVTDTLDKNLFDLTSFAPTSIKIGDKTVDLDGSQNFVTTVDMRTEINAIAQVECKYDRTKGIARWEFTSLDPMTMEPTDNVMSGFLPINDDKGSGIGEVSFNIRLKQAEADGTSIPNQACIVFDTNDPIMTPVWTNIVDAVAPTSRVTTGVIKNDSLVTLRIHASDERSGAWQYDVYQQLNSDGTWNKIVENATDTLIDVRFYDGIDQGFYVCATDSAGNVEVKEPAREWTLNKVYLGDANGDGRINSEDVILAVSKYLGRDVYLNVDAADVNSDGRINSEDVVAIVRLYLEEQVRLGAPKIKPLNIRKRRK